MPVSKSAFFSLCRSYRWALWRHWDRQKPYALFIGLNPSTADEFQDDPTIRRCINYAQAWGYGSLCMVNLFAFRATNPKDMKLAADPVGPDNDRWLTSMAAGAGVIIAGWGNHGSFMGRDQAVMKLIPNMKYLALNGSGQPAHPLYQRADTSPSKGYLIKTPEVLKGFKS